jgi:hypothetical protein
MLTIELDPRGGALGDAFAKLIGSAPHLVAYKALSCFKSLMEIGEI